jgi:hypothetical protein
MENWKRGVIAGSLGAAAILFVKGYRPVAGAVASIALVTLASEHPEAMERLWRHVPEYLEKSNNIVAAIARISERLAEGGMRGAWEDLAR